MRRIANILWAEIFPFGRNLLEENRQNMPNLHVKYAKYAGFQTLSHLSERLKESFEICDALENMEAHEGASQKLLRDALISKKCSFFEHCSKGL